VQIIGLKIVSQCSHKMHGRRVQSYLWKNKSVKSNSKILTPNFFENNSMEEVI